jgi:hypothetical protein
MGLSGGLATGMPAAATVVCGIVGAVVSVWVTHGEAFELSGKWFGKVLGLTALYFLCGLFGARGIITGGAGSDVGMIAAAARMPEWVLCGGIALAAAPLAGLIALLVWLGGALLTRFSSVGGMLAALACAGAGWWLAGNGGRTGHRPRGVATSSTTAEPEE